MSDNIIEDLQRDISRQDARIKSLEHSVSFLEHLNAIRNNAQPPQQPQPAQPERTPRLVEAVEAYVEWTKSGSAVVAGLNIAAVQRQMIDALAAEKKRQELVDEFIDSIRRNDKDCISTESFNRLNALDAFDRERGV